MLVVSFFPTNIHTHTHTHTHIKREKEEALYLIDDCKAGGGEEKAASDTVVLKYLQKRGFKTWSEL